MTIQPSWIRILSWIFVVDFLTNNTSIKSRTSYIVGHFLTIRQGQIFPQTRPDIYPLDKYLTQLGLCVVTLETN
jgi:hypothetical protein